MYGLKQVAIIAYNQRISYMESHGYYPVPFITRLFSHYNRKTKQNPIDNFGVKYFTKNDSNHSLNSLKHYEI